MGHMTGPHDMGGNTTSHGVSGEFVLVSIHTCSYRPAWKLTLPVSLWVVARTRPSAI